MSAISGLATPGDSCSMLHAKISDTVGGMDFGKVSFAKRLFGGERINLIIGAEEKCIIGITTRDAKVIDIRKSPVEDPTLLAYAEMETAEELLESRDINKFKEALDTGEIRIEGTGIINKIKIRLVKLFMRFF